jgi:hypothetical protein
MVPVAFLKATTNSVAMAAKLATTVAVLTAVTLCVATVLSATEPLAVLTVVLVNSAVLASAELPGCILVAVALSVLELVKSLLIFLVLDDSAVNALAQDIALATDLVLVAAVLVLDSLANDADTPTRCR